jgi:hypothetical protein
LGGPAAGSWEALQPKMKGHPVYIGIGTVVVIVIIVLVVLALRR